MLQNIVSHIMSLLCIKNIVTLILTLVFGHLSITGKVDTQDFLSIFSIVIAFYFGSQVAAPSNSKS